MMTRSKEKDSIPEIMTDKQWVFLTRKSKDSSNMNAAFEYDYIYYFRNVQGEHLINILRR